MMFQMKDLTCNVFFSWQCNIQETLTAAVEMITFSEDILFIRSEVQNK